MKFKKILIYLFLIYKTHFHLVVGQTINNEQNDCTKLYNYLKGNSKNFNEDFIHKYFYLKSERLEDEGKDISVLFGKYCCFEGGSILDCDEDWYITRFENFATELEISDITSFPYFSRLEKLYIEDSNSSKTIPENILKSTNLKDLVIFNNTIEIIPPAIQNLSKLEHLNLGENNIKVLPNEIYNLETLRYLHIQDNKIETISPSIENLSNLETLTLARNFIKELPNEIYNLQNLNIIYFEDNLKLNMKLKKFGNSTIEYCNINNVNISCYELHTCAEITYNDKRFFDHEAENELKICNENLNQNDEKKKFPFIIVGDVILGLVIGVVVIIIVKRFKKRYESNSNSNGNFRVISNDNNINNNSNETNIYFISNGDVEENYPPPEYTEHDTNFNT